MKSRYTTLFLVLILWGHVAIAATSDDNGKTDPIPAPKLGTASSGPATVADATGTALVEIENKLKACSLASTPAIASLNPVETFNVNLHRYINTAQLAGCYFARKAKLGCSSVPVSNPDMVEVFGDQSPLGAVDSFLQAQVTRYGGEGWKRNHLAVSVFVIVNDKQKDKKRRIEGTLLVEESGEKESVSHDFSVSPGDKALNGRKKADFMSSNSEDKVILGVIDGYGYLPLSRSSLRPLTDQDNHGDRLALDTISTNIDLFFSLIRRTAHREDLPILGMGVRYYSSYDACNECYRRIYDARTSLKRTLIDFAKSQKYTIADASGEFPFYSLFYSYRPYKETSYAACWQHPNDKQVYNFPLKSDYTFSYGRPAYFFSMDPYQSYWMDPLSKRPSKQLNLLTGDHALDADHIYSHTVLLEAVEYQIPK